MPSRACSTSSTAWRPPAPEQPVKGELPPDPDRLFAAALLDPQADPRAEGARYRPPFAHLALLTQVPGVDVEERLAAEKGSPLDAHERTILAEREGAARAWLESYAPERSRMEVQRDGLPDAGPQPGGDAADPRWRRSPMPWPGSNPQPGTARRCRRRSSMRRARPSCRPAVPSRPSTPPSSDSPTAREPAGCSPAWSPASSWSACGRRPRRIPCPHDRPAAHPRRPRRRQARGGAQGRSGRCRSTASGRPTNVGARWRPRPTSFVRSAMRATSDSAS